MKIFQWVLLFISLSGGLKGGEFDATTSSMLSDGVLEQKLLEIKKVVPISEYPELKSNFENDQELAKEFVELVMSGIVNSQLQDKRRQKVCRHFLNGMDPPPVGLMVSKLFASNSGKEKITILRYLKKKMPVEDGYISIVEKMLEDQSPGFEVHGEMRARRKVGLRVCDVAYNIMMQKYSLSEQYGYILLERPISVADSMIARLNNEWSPPVTDLVKFDEELGTGEVFRSERTFKGTDK